MGRRKERRVGEGQGLALRLLEADAEAVGPALGLAVDGASLRPLQLRVGLEPERLAVAALKGRGAKIGRARARFAALQHRHLAVVEGVALASVAGEIESDAPARALHAARPTALDEGQVVDDAVRRQPHDIRLACGRRGARQGGRGEARETEGGKAAAMHEVLGQVGTNESSEP